MNERSWKQSPLLAMCRVWLPTEDEKSVLKSDSFKHDYQFSVTNYEKGQYSFHMKRSSLSTEKWFSLSRFLFFFQICAFISRREYTLVSITTLSPPVCISKDLNTAEQLTSLFYGPMYLLVLIVIIFKLGQVALVRRFIVNHSVINTLWALISFSYASLTYPSFQLLSCYKFNGKYVLYSDPSMECFGKDHLPYGILAILVILLLVIPIPLILFFMRSSPRLKPLVDVYMSYVKSDYPWWIAVAMARRLAIAFLAAYIPTAEVRQMVLAVVVQVSLFVHVVLLPFNSHHNNIIEAALLGNVCIFAMLNVVAPAPKWSLAASLVFFWPTVIAIVRGLFRQRLRIKRDLLSAIFQLCNVCHVYQHPEDKDKQRYSIERPPELLTDKDQTLRAGQVYELRDNVLADSLPELNE